MEENVQKDKVKKDLGIFSFLRNKYFKFGVATGLYLLFIIWLGNFWLLFGIAIIFDIYVSQKVNWTFWKKRNQKNSAFIEWLDALIFAVVAVTFINIYLFQNYKIPTPSMEKTMLVGDHLYVSKVAYGPRVPFTPISFPFTANKLPIFKTEGYLKWIQRPYKRLKGFGKVQRDDVVVFNFPAGDTVVLAHSERSYYSIVRDYAKQLEENDKMTQRPMRTWQEYLKTGRQLVWDDYEIVIRPVDKRDNYIKRCVAITGDTLTIFKGQIYINGKPSANYQDVQHRYYVKTNGTPINPKRFEKLGIAKSDQEMMNNDYVLPLIHENVEILKGYKNVVTIDKYESLAGQYNYQIFPHHPDYQWSLDYFGPLWMPEKGTTIDLTMDNLPLYRRIIEKYEDNILEIVDSTIYINGEIATTYTFDMDYYYMIGDNRHYSSDCRYWGFVPEDHIMGKPKFIWLSLDKDKRFLGKIRWNRMFMSTDKL
jgi:signal peptidase I